MGVANYTLRRRIIVISDYFSFNFLSSMITLRTPDILYVLHNHLPSSL